MISAGKLSFSLKFSSDFVTALGARAKVGLGASGVLEPL